MLYGLQEAAANLSRPQRCETKPRLIFPPLRRLLGFENHRGAVRSDP